MNGWMDAWMDDWDHVGIMVGPFREYDLFDLILDEGLETVSPSCTDPP